MSSLRAFGFEKPAVLSFFSVLALGSCHLLAFLPRGGLALPLGGLRAIQGAADLGVEVTGAAAPLAHQLRVPGIVYDPGRRLALAMMVRSSAARPGVRTIFRAFRSTSDSAASVTSNVSRAFAGL